MTEGVAFVFPGQGSQTVGMGRDLYDTFQSARSVIDQADQVLKFPLSRLFFEGPEEELRQTVNAQPALLTVAFACLKAMEEVTSSGMLQPAFTAGHSLGEYTALASANVIDFPTAVYLARERGRLMQEAGKVNPGGMLAVLGMDEKALAEVCRETGTQIANYNCPGQFVISGASADLAKAADLAKTRGASRTLPLQVSGAFHSSLMKPAEDALAIILKGITFKDPRTPIVGNTTATALKKSQEVKDELNRQLCHGVQWQRSIEFMASNGVSRFIEIGPGKVLTGLIKRIDKNLSTINVGDVAGVRAFASPK
jgi:[acyl-carrier-protein] S-malonyltransferase